MRPTTRRPIAVRAVTLVLAAGALLAACAPMPTPTPPATWTPTYVQGNADSDARFTTTTANWFVVLRTSTTNGLPTTLDIYRRTGPGGRPAATPTQSLGAAGGVPVAIAMTDQVLAIATRFGDQVSASLLRYDAANDGWTPFAPFAAVPTDPALRTAPDTAVTLDVTDTAVALGLSAANGSTTPGRVVVQQLAVTPTTVTIGAIQTLTPDPAWFQADQAGFGRSLSMEGDLLAVASGGDHVVFYRSPGGQGPWTVDGLLDAPPTTATTDRFGKAVAADTDGGVPRVLVSTSGSLSVFGPTTAGSVELWRRDPAGWVSAGSVVAPPDQLGGAGFGQRLALDGDLAAVGNAATPLGPSQPFPAAQRLDFGVYVYRVGSGTQEALLSGILPGRAVATLGTTGLGDLTLVGGHLSTILGEGFVGGGGQVHSVSWDRVTAG